MPHWEAESQQFALLIGRAKAGSIQAFDELYNRTARWLLSHVRRIIDDGQAEDVLAEVYIQIWRSLESYDEQRAPPAVWLVMIARSRALDHLRREKRQADLHQAEQMARSAETESAEGPEQILSRLEQRRMVQLSLEALNEDERLVIGLAYFRDNSHSQIAEVTGLPLGTVKSLMGRAQEKLRSRMAVTATSSAASQAQARSSL